MFRVVNSRHQVEPPERNVVVLERDLWDDFGIKSSFRVYVPGTSGYERLGTWKIVDRTVGGPRLTDLPKEFVKLPPEFVSLGQELAAYERLVQLGRDIASAILAGLHDLLFEPLASVEKLDVFHTSLARFTDARRAYQGGRVLLQSHGLLSSRPAASPMVADDTTVQVWAELVGFANPHELELHFSRRPEMLGVRRAVVLVGPNGSGKTQLLGALGRALSGLERKNVRLRPETPFDHVLAVSYGAFDHFTAPRLRHAEISYSYCGLRVASKDSSKEDTRITLDLEHALQLAAQQIFELNNGPRRGAWTEALQRVQVVDLDDPRLNNSTAILDVLRNRLSAGQKVVVLTLANLCTYLEPNSIVLHDEPETHLHPSLLSAMLRAIHGLLDRFDSYALVATHSLVPLQETPSTNVVVLNKSDEGIVTVDQPIEQCFAATLDEISRVAFRSSDADENFRTALKRLRDRYSVEEIREFLGGQLGLGTEMLLASLKR